MNFSHETVGCNLQFDFKAAYLSTDSDCIWTQDIEEEVWM